MEAGAIAFMVKLFENDCFYKTKNPPVKMGFLSINRTIEE
jgi:hypothetical protein|tara:strand:- start:41 stop:160 length:120 start_codon:yes stop_codon:yes gene_type:complete